MNPQTFKTAQFCSPWARYRTRTIATEMDHKIRGAIGLIATRKIWSRETAREREEGQCGGRSSHFRNEVT